MNHLRIIIVFALIMPQVVVGQPTATPKAVQKKNLSEIFIPLRGREEVKVIPLLDTLYPTKQYLFHLTFAEKYKFSELFMDKGLAVRTDSFLTIIPKTNRTSGMDTATLRIIGFANNSRILMYHQYYIVCAPKVFPILNPSPSAVTVNNLALQRGMKYSRSNFPERCIFGYDDVAKNLKDNVITEITLSLVNKDMTKNLFVKDNRPNEDMIKEIKKAKSGTNVYIRLDIKNGKKKKSVWTRFILTN